MITITELVQQLGSIAGPMKTKWPYTLLIGIAYLGVAQEHEQQVPSRQ